MCRRYNTLGSMRAKFLARLSLRVYNELNVVPERRLAPRRSSDPPAVGGEEQRESEGGGWRRTGGGRAREEAELKYQGARDSLVNGTSADFPDYERRAEERVTESRVAGECTAGRGWKMCRREGSRFLQTTRRRQVRIAGSGATISFTVSERDRERYPCNSVKDKRHGKGDGKEGCFVRAYRRDASS